MPSMQNLPRGGSGLHTSLPSFPSSWLWTFLKDKAGSLHQTFPWSQKEAHLLVYQCGLHWFLLGTLKSPHWPCVSQGSEYQVLTGLDIFAVWLTLLTKANSSEVKGKGERKAWHEFLKLLTLILSFCVYSMTIHETSEDTEINKIALLLPWENLQFKRERNGSSAKLYTCSKEI